MKRWFLNVLAGVSLLLAVLVIWLALPHGRAVYTFFHRTGSGSYQLLEFYPGKVAVGISNHSSFNELAGVPPPTPAAWGYQAISQSGPWPVTGSIWQRMGFAYWPSDGMLVMQNGEYVDYRHWFVPTGLVAGILMLPAAIALGLRLRRRRQRAAGLCTVCGYDLRATPERCPECGAAVGHGLSAESS